MCRSGGEELLPPSPEECGAECLSSSTRDGPSLYAYLTRLRPHALSALRAYCGGRGSLPLDPLLSALIDDDQTVTVCAAVIRPSVSQLADMCRLVEFVDVSA